MFSFIKNLFCKKPVAVNPTTYGYAKNPQHLEVNQVGFCWYGDNPREVVQNIAEMSYWCGRQNMEVTFIHHPRGWCVWSFSNATDTLLFKITWGGKSTDVAGMVEP